MNNRDPFNLRRQPLTTQDDRHSYTAPSTERSFEAQSSSSTTHRVTHSPAPLAIREKDEGMSFAIPGNVPSFSNPQRRHEDQGWSHTMQNGRDRAVGISSGVGEKIGQYFDKTELPMYKDKPYSVTGSRRHRALWQKKRTYGVLSIVVVLLYWLGLFSSSEPGPKGGEGAARAKAVWDRIRNGDTAVANWDSRKNHVKEAFDLSWTAYERHAWGYDEFYPLSKKGRQMAPKGLGWIIVDSLDTLIIMNQTSKLKSAREWVATSLTYDQNQDVNTFETTIRMLGGFLSAHYLSTQYPELASLAEDDEGATGEDLYLEKATDLANRLLGAFETATGIPLASVNLATGEGISSNEEHGVSSTAEATSVQLEMKYLSKLTGEKNFWDKVEKVMQVVDDNGAKEGLLPIFLSPQQGTFHGENIRLGSRGDSYYEYLIKQYLQTSEEEPVYLEMWEESLAGIRNRMITYSQNANLTVLGELPYGLDGELSPKMDHLVCFMPGTIALAATGGATEAEARKSAKWGKKQESEMELARELMQTCYGMYKVTKTGLAPEISYFNIHNPPILEKDKDKVKLPLGLGNAEDAEWRSDYDIRSNDEHNLQRPETVESLFYMYRITGDEMYRQWGWEIFKAFIVHTAVADGGGFTSLSSVQELPPSQRDNMESFWLAETLKYLYLLFSPPDFLPLDQVVINTEAHIFPRFQLGQLFSTGWKRKPRDKDGNIV